MRCISITAVVVLLAGTTSASLVSFSLLPFCHYCGMNAILLNVSSLHRVVVVGIYSREILEIKFQWSCNICYALHIALVKCLDVFSFLCCFFYFVFVFFSLLILWQHSNYYENVHTSCCNVMLHVNEFTRAALVVHITEICTYIHAFERINIWLDVCLVCYLNYAIIYNYYYIVVVKSLRHLSRVK